MDGKILGLTLKIGCGAAGLFLCVGSWYYFWGRHPHVTLTKSLPDHHAPVCAQAGPHLMVVATGKSVTALDLASGKEKWTANLESATATATKPTVAATPAPTDPRVARLKDWYADLARRRSKPMTQEETQAFNADAAKYQAEVAALHAPAAPSSSVKPAAAKTAKTAKTAPGSAGTAGLGSADAEILRTRYEKEKERLRLWNEKVGQMKSTAKSPLQLSALKEETAHYQTALASLKKDEARLPKASAPAAAPAPVLMAAPAMERFDDYVDERSLKIAPLGAMVWVVSGPVAFGLERDTGRIAKRVALPGQVRRIWVGSTNCYLLSDLAGWRQLLRIGADGAATALTVSADAGRSHSAEGASGPVIEAHSADFVVEGDTLLQLDSTLLEQKITERQAMKLSSAEDWEKVDKETHSGWGGDALKIAQAMENDSRRAMTGGVERVDESSYQAAVSRPLEGGKRIWSGRVTGRPALYSLPSLDLIIAGVGLVAIDRGGKPLWEAKLAYPVPPISVDWQHPDREPSPPCQEAGPMIYVYDRAFLTAFRKDTGVVAWRLPNVGIRKLIAEPDGALYVCTENKPADAVQFSQDARLPGGQACSILKVDGQTGKIRWNVPKYQDCFVSDGAVYATREVVGAIDPFARQAPTGRFLLFKLNRFSGAEQWEWNQPGQPLQIEPDGRSVSLLFNQEFQALSSMAF